MGESMKIGFPRRNFKFSLVSISPATVGGGMDLVTRGFGPKMMSKTDPFSYGVFDKKCRFPTKCQNTHYNRQLLLPKKRLKNQN